MTQQFSALGLDREANYRALAQRFRPNYARIRAGALQREQQRELLHVPLHWLREVRFGALRVPVAFGGCGATLPQLFALLTELAAADSNLSQALRAHFGFVESILTTDDAAKQQRWFTRLVEGDWVGNAWSEPGNAKQRTFSTTVLPHDAGFELNGEKFYTTGSLYADWINIGASDENQMWVGVTVNRHHPGVEVIDDWDGFGQRLTASGTTRFHQVPVAAEDISRHDASVATRTATPRVRRRTRRFCKSSVKFTAPSGRLRRGCSKARRNWITPGRYSNNLSWPMRPISRPSWWWRNARTLVSHNPRVYKERIVGDFVVNGQGPSYQWRIGTV